MVGRGVSVPGGLIPARAGTTTPSRGGSTIPRAHPRAGGDHVDVLRARTVSAGSSPRGRGPRVEERRCQSPRRLIPARAGTTSSTSGSRTRPRAHPRAGGDHRADLGDGRQHAGSSPRGRGPPAGPDPAGRAPGLIPARAGTTSRPMMLPWRGGAHPRAGGDHAQWVYDKVTGPGSSPRGRGPQVIPRSGDRPARLIPARAGTTTDGSTPPSPTAAHPRAGGDHPSAPAAPVAPIGSSPRGRGPPAVVVASGVGERLIPARAGTTCGQLPIRPDQPAHPRAGGDHLPLLIFMPMTLGSSPRGRGPHEPGCAGSGYERLIPARAGTTSAMLRRSHTWAAHPRAGGDHTQERLDLGAPAGSSPRGRGPPATM